MYSHESLILDVVFVNADCYDTGWVWILDPERRRLYL
jgi:hypothetical protein